MSKSLSLEILHDPTTSAVGKFYMALLDGQCPLVLYGPCKSGAGGTKKVYSDITKVSSKVQEKKRANYSRVPLSKIPTSAQTNFRNIVANAYGVKPADVTLYDTFVDIGATSSAGPKSRAPRRRSTKEINVWI